jgi:hypothetical protein
MLLRRLLLALAFCGVAHAAPPPHIELVAAPAWKGWTRPGRVTEIDIRLRTDTTTHVMIDVAAGRQSARAELDLQPGRVEQLQVPMPSVQQVTVSARTSNGSPQRSDIVISLSESPLLGVALTTDAAAHLDGFHTVALDAQDFPRIASAYASIDALIVDARTLAALDQQQLGALLAHAAQCGRIAVLNADAQVRRLMDGAGGCGGHALMNAASVTQALDMLESSLAVPVPAPIALGDIGELVQPGQAIWSRVAVGLAVYFALAALVLMFFTSVPVLLATPTLAAFAAVALLHAAPRPSQITVWSEGESGARVARYRAWQQFPGVVRERARVALPPQLSSSAQPCEPSQAMRLDFDGRRGLATIAEFDTRLFHQVSLCYSGSFPMSRTLAIQTRRDGLRDVRNAGTKAWPPGVLLVAGLAYELPALDPGANTTIGARTGQPRRNAVVRTAMMRTQLDGVAALWELELDGVADLPVDSKGWLLVSMPAPVRVVQ